MKKQVKTKVVIIGAGFGGVYAALKLRPAVKKNLVDLTIVNPQDYFLFTPLLHEVASGSLSANSIIESFDYLCPSGKAKIITASAQKIISQANQVVLSDGQILNYDYLILATGATTNDYDLPGVAEHALMLKTLPQALEVKKNVLKVLYSQDVPTIAVIGSGPTGVELVGELADLSADINPQAKCLLISAGPQILTEFPGGVRYIADQKLRHMGVKILLSSKVQSLEKNKIYFDDGKTIDADLIIWTAGVKPEIVAGDINFDLLSGRLAVNEYLQVIGQKNIYAVGDVAGFCPTSQTQPLPMLAQVAVRQGRTAAINILADINNRQKTKFNYRIKGLLISLGRWQAAGEIFGLTISGRLAWWLWRTVYLFKFLSKRKRLAVAWQWTVSLIGRHYIK